MTENLPSVQARAGALAENELLDVLRVSLYPGAKDASIKLVLGYCKAAGLDPMMKPVHIVPMWSKESNGMRDVIMPGIGLYRVQAARTGSYAGMSDPEFGPMRELTIGDSTTEYPEWCKVTVRRRMPDGFVAEFSAVEYWVENYATAKRDTQRPNEMWARRPRGQLAKVCEAQALRKAFPEIGSMPTMEEMEGRSHAVDGAGEPPPPEPAPPPRVGRKPKQAEAPPPADVIDAEPKPAPTEQQPIDMGQTPPPPPPKPAPSPGTPFVSEGACAWARNKAKSMGKDIDTILAENCGGLVLDRMTVADFDELKAVLREMEASS